jgi:hypothetical protein
MTGKPGADPGPERLGPHVLREYALLADGERGAVLGPAGDRGPGRRWPRLDEMLRSANPRRTLHLVVARVTGRARINYRRSA